MLGLSEDGIVLLELILVEDSLVAVWGQIVRRRAWRWRSNQVAWISRRILVFERYGDVVGAITEKGVLENEELVVRHGDVVLIE